METTKENTNTTKSIQLLLLKDLLGTHVIDHQIYELAVKKVTSTDPQNDEKPILAGKW